MNPREIINKLAQVQMVGQTMDVPLITIGEVEELIAAAKALPKDWDVRRVAIVVEDGMADVAGVDGPCEVFLVDYDVECYDEELVGDLRASSEIGGHRAVIDVEPFSEATGQSFLDEVSAAWGKWAVTAEPEGVS